MSDNKLIEIQHLRKEYEEVTPLLDVNVTINKGDIIAVIGPSGTGKSTLLRCINLLERPTSGKIIVDGEDITDHKCDINKVRTKLGMVFQSFNLYNHLTVVENCMLAQTTLLKRSRQEAYEKAMELLKSVGMEDFALSYPEQLSGGQKQRVAIARTLSTDPEIILFDEPTSALDPLTVGEVEEIIAKLAGEGCTMMIVTHGIEFARSISNRVFYMDQGGIYEDGPPEQVFDEPEKERTRKFIRRLACLEKKLTEDDGHDLRDEFQDIFGFLSNYKIETKRIVKVCNAYEEFYNLVMRYIVGEDKTVYVSLEYYAKEDKLTLSMAPSSTVEMNEEFYEKLENTLEYKILCNYSLGYKNEEADEGFGRRFTMEL